MYILITKLVLLLIIELTAIVMPLKSHNKTITFKTTPASIVDFEQVNASIY